jgi:glycosyltransferase involved in cell wall biosynthesis
MSTRTIVIASLPGRGLRNPYVDLFYDALEANGVELYPEPEVDPTWAAEHFAKVDALHFHWPEWIWQRAPAPLEEPEVWRTVKAKVPGAWRIDQYANRLFQTEPIRRARRERIKKRAVAQFVEFLSAARLAGVKVLWTMHNIEAHDGRRQVDSRGFRALARSADLIICHSLAAKRECLHRYRPTCPIIVMPHGNYDGWYPKPRARDEVLDELGLDKARPVVGCIGALRGYKGIDVALNAVRRLEGAVQILVAGLPHRSFYMPDLERLAKETQGAVLVSRSLSDQEFADYCSACDALLLPYRKITGSGALLAALTLGRGVIASDLPYFREILQDSSEAGMLVPANDPDALADGLQRYLDIDSTRRAAAARRLAEKYAWSEVVQPVLQELRRMNLPTRARAPR